MTDRATDTECLSKRLTVDVPTAARLLGVSRNTLYEAIRLREFPAIRVGRRILVPTSYLLNLAGSQTQLLHMNDAVKKVTARLMGNHDDSVSRYKIWE